MAKLTANTAPVTSSPKTGAKPSGKGGKLTGSVTKTPVNAGAKTTAAPTLTSPSTRAAARAAGDAMLAGSGVNPHKPHKAQGATVAAAPAETPQAAKPPPGMTAVIHNGKPYLRHDATGMLYLQQEPAGKRGRKAAPVVNASLRVSYLLEKNIGQQKPGVIFEDVPCLWGTENVYTGVLVSAECAVAPGETWGYMYIAGITGQKGTAERAKLAAAFARAANIVSNGSDLNKAPGQAWLTCETSINEREQKAGHTMPDSSNEASED